MSETGTKDGQIIFPERAAPTDLANHGQIWTETDNTIHFMDGAGTEHIVLIGSTGTKHEFHMPFEDPTGTVGNWDVVTINASQAVHFVFQVAEDFESVANAKVVMIPDATETIQWDVNVSVAAVGEAYNNDDRAAADQQQAVTSGNLTEIDISGQLTGLTAGDYVAVDFQSDTANLRIIGFEFDYN
jgi:hypothetical protein